MTQTSQMKGLKRRRRSNDKRRRLLSSEGIQDGSERVLSKGLVHLEPSRACVPRDMEKMVCIPVDVDVDVDVDGVKKMNIFECVFGHRRVKCMIPK